jgi:hypothetical protein
LAKIEGYFSVDYFEENFGKGSRGTSPRMCEKRVEEILQGILPAFTA